jgi:hypothetical protein
MIDRKACVGSLERPFPFAQRMRCVCGAVFYDHGRLDELICPVCNRSFYSDYDGCSESAVIVVKAAKKAARKARNAARSSAKVPSGVDVELLISLLKEQGGISDEQIALIKGSLLA